jgi:hypothetical protein
MCTTEDEEEMDRIMDELHVLKGDTRGVCGRCRFQEWVNENGNCVLCAQILLNEASDRDDS